MTDDEETALIERARAQDTAAFGKLVQIYQGRIRSYIASYLRWPDIVDDLAQEVFLSAFNSLGDFRGDSAFAVWLFGIARNRVLRVLRKNLHERRSFETLLGEARIAQVVAEEEPWKGQEQAMAALQRCLSALPSPSADLVAQHYFGARSLVDIARDLGKAESTIRVNLLRIRRALQACVEKRLALETR